MMLNRIMYALGWVPKKDYIDLRDAALAQVREFKAYQAETLKVVDFIRDRLEIEIPIKSTFNAEIINLKEYRK